MPSWKLICGTETLGLPHQVYPEMLGLPDFKWLSKHSLAMRNLIVLIKCILCVSQCLPIPLQSICQNFIDTTSKLIRWILVSSTGKIFYCQIRNLGFETIKPIGVTCWKKEKRTNRPKTLHSKCSCFDN